MKTLSQFLQRGLILFFSAYICILPLFSKSYCFTCVCSNLFLMSLCAHGFWYPSATRLWCEMKMGIRLGRNMKLFLLLLQKFRGVLSCLLLEWFSVAMQQNNKIYWKHFLASCFSSPPVSIFKLLWKFQCGDIERAGGILTKSYNQSVASKLFLDAQGSISTHYYINLLIY